MRGTRSNRSGLCRCCSNRGACSRCPACSTIDQVRGKDGASSEKEARDVAPATTPWRRPIQVGWTSARATHCGFIFDPDQLRSNYLASEAQAGATPEQMQKIVRAYDYTRESDARQHQRQSPLLQQGADRRDPERPQPLSGRGLRALGADGAAKA